MAPFGKSFCNKLHNSESFSTTQSSTVIWLIGQPCSGMTLRRVFFEMKSKQSTLTIACNSIADEVLSFWSRANVATKAMPHIVGKLTVLHQLYIRVAENKHRKSSAQKKLENSLTSYMETGRNWPRYTLTVSIWLINVAHGWCQCLQRTSTLRWEAPQAKAVWAKASSSSIWKIHSKWA